MARGKQPNQYTKDKDQSFGEKIADKLDIGGDTSTKNQGRGRVKDPEHDRRLKKNR